MELRLLRLSPPWRTVSCCWGHSLATGVSLSYYKNFQTLWLSCIHILPLLGAFLDVCLDWFCTDTMLLSRKISRTGCSSCQHPLISLNSGSLFRTCGCIWKLYLWEEILPNSCHRCVVETVAFVFSFVKYLLIILAEICIDN